MFVTPVGGTYYAHVGRGLTGHVGALLPALPEVERGLIIESTEDEVVAARVADGFAGAGIPVHRVALPDTEASKTFQSAERLANAFAGHAMHKNDLVIAVGGEAIGDIASRDERERGDRLFLNYGHTFAHAIELVRDTAPDDQGEAVALGMVAAAYLAFRQGRIPQAVVDQHRQLLAGLGLPVTGEFRLQDLQQAWMRDKKYRHGIRFVVLNALGRPQSGVTADEATLQLVLGDLAKSKSFHRTDPA